MLLTESVCNKPMNGLYLCYNERSEFQHKFPYAGGGKSEIYVIINADSGTKPCGFEFMRLLKRCVVRRLAAHTYVIIVSKLCFEPLRRIIVEENLLLPHHGNTILPGCKKFIISLYRQRAQLPENCTTLFSLFLGIADYIRCNY